MQGEGLGEALAPLHPPHFFAKVEINQNKK